jgi:dCTP deaminase
MPMGLFSTIVRLFSTDITGGALTGDMIKQEVDAGRIQISDFDVKNLNANSYNIRCGDTFTVYMVPKVIDLHDPDTYKETKTFELGTDGTILRPGNLYLIPTKEIIGSKHYVPIITGRSSIGRLGIVTHKEAGFGDLGYYGVWTMQITVTYPTMIYPNDPIAQVYFLTPVGKTTRQYNGKYQGSKDAVPSRWRGPNAHQDD